MFDVNADITFIKKQKSRPYYDSSAITGMVPKLYFKTENKKVLIRDIRKLKNYSLDKNGFEFYKKDFEFNSDDVLNDYVNYKNQLKEFLKEIIDFKYIEIFDITKRSNRKTGAYNFDGPRQPAERAHVDYTETSGPKRAKQILKNKILEFKKRRIIQLNLWRPISRVVLSSPLAVADASTIKNNDLIATDQIFPNRVGEIYHLAYNSAQDWYWVSEMRSNELLIFKGWDNNNSEKVSRFTPHTSFNLESQDLDAFPRESVEARIYLIL